MPIYTVSRARQSARSGRVWSRPPQRLFDRAPAPLADAGGLATALLISFTAAAIGGYFTAQRMPTWYARLDKPDFNPPRQVFGPVWTVLYALMGVALWRVWRTPEWRRDKQRAYAAFAAQLGLNTAWSAAFFGLKSPLAGLVVIGGLLGAIGETICRFGHIDPLAGALLKPYLAWVGFASLLNAAIWHRNRA